MPLPPINPSGVSTAFIYPTQTRQGLGWTQFTDQTPPNTNAPIIFEPFPELSGNEYAVWMIITGGANWGGCTVNVSVDGIGGPYVAIGFALAGGVQGFTSADYPLGSDPDTVDTLSVNLSISQGQLVTATTNDADLFVTLCYLGGELISYSNVTLTSQYNYNLTNYVRRGIYGTTIGDHPIGSQFGRILPSTFRQRYAANLIGTTLWFKFPAFNTLGLMGQSLADVPAYSYTLMGVGVSPGGLNVCPVDVVLAAGGSMDWGILGSVVSARCDWGLLGGPATLVADMGVLGL